jgi:hypothetical protein
MQKKMMQLSSPHIVRCTEKLDRLWRKNSRGGSVRARKTGNLDWVNTVFSSVFVTANWKKKKNIQPNRSG